ncbi:hypothetical protein [Nocardioides kribbensis]|uniref:SRPBCC family protein n=1 Tax=Nocardioides kribbensis TaxID=305517 RepID=A0ABV1P077_9ACTN
MHRRSTLRTTTRASDLPVSAEHAWRAVTAAGAAERWYVDAAPFAVRGAIDRLTLGRGRRWPVPEHPQLRAGDTAGFWRVVSAGPHGSGGTTGHRLVLDAAVRAPGLVTWRTTVTPLTGPDGSVCRVENSVTFTPGSFLGGLPGRAYLLTDLPARELLTELVHHRVVRDVTA